MKVTIQAVKPHDADCLKVFMARVIAASVTQDPVLLADLRVNVGANVEWWLAHPADAVHLKAVDGEQLVGVVLVKQCWNLCSLFVDAGRQRRGVGRALIEAATLRCQGRSPKGALWLNAAPGATAFYRRLGFVERTPTNPLPPGFTALERAL